MSTRSVTFIQDPQLAAFLKQHEQAAACRRQRFYEINQSREPALRAHLAQGGRLQVDFGCGDGRFGAALADRTQRWVLGIDASAIHLQVSERFTLEDYACANRFYLLPQSYEDLLDIGLAGSWADLRGTVEKGFLIMPQPPGVGMAQAALNLWLAMASPKAEFHVRTEITDLIGKLRFGCRVETLPFDPMVADISSHHTFMSRQAGQEIFEQGFRLGN